MSLIDTHAHIYLKEFKPDVEEVMARAQENGVDHIYLPNIDHTTIDDMLALEESFPESCTATMGLHPCSVKKDFEKELYIVENWLSKRRFVAIGEVGTDLHWDKSFWEEQKEALKVQVGFAKKYQIPLIIHCRASIDETIAILQKENDEGLNGVFHCFGGNEEQARQIVEMGFLLGLGGVATFKNSGMDQVIPTLDLKDIVLETDSPYLSPVPYRGRRNEPSYLTHIAEKIASLKAITLEEVSEKTTQNAKKLFRSFE